MTSNPRIAALQRMAEAHPRDSRPRFGLALEYEKQQRWQEMADVLREYLQLADDEGNAFGRLAEALLHLGRDAEAREALQRGIEAAQRHGHPTMAGEFEDRLDEMN